MLSTKPQEYNSGNMYLPYLYLRPSDMPDYCNIGIQEDTELSSSFSLYDAARRAFNCLTLLYTDPQDSLIPVTVSEFQKKLVQNIASVSQLAATRFYPKPRVGLGKGPQPLRCHPILVEQISAQGHHGGAVDPFPPHASFFHTAVDHQGHGPLDHTTADPLALPLPLLL